MASSFSRTAPSTILFNSWIALSFSVTVTCTRVEVLRTQLKSCVHSMVTDQNQGSVLNVLLGYTPMCKLYADESIMHIKMLECNSWLHLLCASTNHDNTPLTVTTVFFRVSAHARVSTHPPFLAFLAIWGGTRVSAHPSPSTLKHVLTSGQAPTQCYCTYMYMYTYVLGELFGARKGKFTRYFKSALFNQRPRSPSHYPTSN